MTADTRRTPGEPRAVLAIGVHREELAFGDRVAEGLDRSRIDVLRIPQGLPARRPSQEQAFYYTTTHQELYLQILRQVRGRWDLLVDLHCGLNEPGRCADLFSAHRALLDCACAEPVPAACADPVRPILLGDGDPAGDDPSHPPMLRAHTVIPEAVWSSPELVYVGLEVFLPAPGAAPGAGIPDDWALARTLIGRLLDCLPAPKAHA